MIGREDVNRLSEMDQERVAMYEIAIDDLKNFDHIIDKMELDTSTVLGKLQEEIARKALEEAVDWLMTMKEELIIWLLELSENDNV